jgi:fructose/tagatose bisphosphate aldolase
MAIISLRQLLDHAAEHGYGCPAYNVNNMEQMHRRRTFLRRRTIPASPDPGRC